MNKVELLGLRSKIQNLPPNELNELNSIILTAGISFYLKCGKVYTLVLKNERENSSNLTIRVIVTKLLKFNNTQFRIFLENLLD